MCRKYEQLGLALIGCGIGVLLSLVLPGTMIVGREESAIEQSSALVEQRLTYGETALHRLYAAIGLDPEQKAQQEREHIFDKAANKVCRQCTRYSTCWERNAQSTYQTLRSALGTILDRGEAQRDDFPTEFAQECRHMEGLLVALNQELSSIACRSRSRGRSETSFEGEGVPEQRRDARFGIKCTESEKREKYLLCSEKKRIIIELIEQSGVDPRGYGSTLLNRRK